MEKTHTKERSTHISATHLLHSNGAVRVGSSTMAATVRSLRVPLPTRWGKPAGTLSVWHSAHLPFQNISCNVC